MLRALWLTAIRPPQVRANVGVEAYNRTQSGPESLATIRGQADWIGVDR